MNSSGSVSGTSTPYERMSCMEPASRSPKYANVPGVGRIASSSSPLGNNQVRASIRPASMPST